MMNAIGRERGWPPIDRRLFHHDHFLAQMSVGTIPHPSVLRSIELLGTEVAPVVRAEVARRSAA
jgi:hypothetical protein